MQLAPETPIRTTSGTIALFNLDAQIEGLERQAAGPPTTRWAAELVDHLTLRGQMLSRISDYEWAAEVGAQIAHAAPGEGLAFLVRARTRAWLHRFDEALADLDVAHRRGVTGDEVDQERAAVFQGVGRYDEALALRRAAVERRGTFETLGGLAVLQAERGEVAEAERLFDESRARFRGVSPFGLAQLDFQRGHMWHGRDPARAREWYAAALDRLPAYAQAEGHLAEIEAEMGESRTAIARLRRLADASDDPDYATQLARILGQVGESEEAVSWRARAEARYVELITRHPAAFADHAADFWLSVGGDPQRALPLARQNAENRPTRRAQALLARAMAACENGPARLNSRPTS